MSTLVRGGWYGSYHWCRVWRNGVSPATGLRTQSAELVPLCDLAVHIFLYQTHFYWPQLC
jgi:hypothetical protein